MVDVVHSRVLQDFFVNKKEYGHIDLISGPKTLFLETEALDFVEIHTSLGRKDVIGRNSGDCLVGVILSSVERQSCLSRNYLDLALLRPELPGHLILHICSERDAQHTAVRRRYQVRGLNTVYSLGSPSEARRLTENFI